MLSRFLLLGQQFSNDDNRVVHFLGGYPARRLHRVFGRENDSRGLDASVELVPWDQEDTFDDSEP